MDYTRLHDLLKAGRLKEADKETARVMLVVAKREKERKLTVKDIDEFPCEDLRIIDQLWIKYSNNKFGFSVQTRICQSLGKTREYNREIWNKFGYKVGWREGGEWLHYNDITFDKNAPEGHLPTPPVGWIYYICTSSYVDNFGDRKYYVDEPGDEEGWWVLRGCGVDSWYLFSRVETCKL
ncbi:MAG: GUN4 domain-containing protein [Dolichospermum sp. WA123]|nr:GUN4 domain-containing protein [Dolichospermum sp. WA123]